MQKDLLIKEKSYILVYFHPIILKKYRFRKIYSLLPIILKYIDLE
jgi:hypothetical protein